MRALFWERQEPGLSTCSQGMFIHLTLVCHWLETKIALVAIHMIIWRAATEIHFNLKSMLLGITKRRRLPRGTGDSLFSFLMYADCNLVKHCNFICREQVPHT